MLPVMLPDSVGDGIRMFSIYQIQTQADSEHPDESRDGMMATFILRHYRKSHLFARNTCNHNLVNKFYLNNWTSHIRKERDLFDLEEEEIQDRSIA
jgi:hypothetical protein